MTKEKYGLNDEQWTAVMAKSPTIIHASAGSGKTRCLISKIRILLDQEINPENILAITFTNKAANEMKERLKSFFPDIKKMQVSTIHSMCVQIIRKFIKHTPLKIPFSIYDDGDQLNIVKTIIKSRNFLSDPYKALEVISRVKSDLNEDILDGDLKTIYDTYQDILLKNNACDFDDLLVYAFKCLGNKDCHDYYSNLWQHILCDEFQDTSTIQYKILCSIQDDLNTETLFVIGDPNQSVYGWRGARPDNMDDFIKQFKPTVCSLLYNYRSCSEVIDYANDFLQFGDPMIPKTATTGKMSFSVFNSQEDEAEKIATAIMTMGNYEETAILFRVNTRTLLFEKVFSQKRIPYKIVGALPFYRRKVAKDLLSYCKAACNHSDIESLVRIVNTPKRGFGESKQEKLLHEGWPYLEEMALQMPLIDSFIDLLKNIRDKTPFEAISEIVYQTNYREYLSKDNDRLMLNSFLEVVSGFNTLEELILASNFLEEDKGHGVKLMSAHASKGLEFDRVFVVGVEDGVWPHKLSMDSDEESRLYYVSLTRARKYLNVSYARSKIFRGSPIEILPSYLFTKSYESYTKRKQKST